VVVDGVQTLQRSSCGERPARTALSLVLNWGDSVLLSPVDGGWKINGAQSNFVADLVGDLKSSVDGLELLLAEVSEFVHCQFEGSVWLGVVVVDDVNVVLEGLVTSSKLIVGVDLSVSAHELAELGTVSIFGLKSKGRDGQKDNKQSNSVLHFFWVVELHKH